MYVTVTFLLTPSVSTVEEYQEQGVCSFLLWFCFPRSTDVVLDTLLGHDSSVEV